MTALQEHPIGVATRRTGLSSHVIRIWERRYGAVKPSRTETNRRMYSDDDIRRLSLLKQATSLGRSIGQVAYLSDQELRELVGRDLEEIRGAGQMPGRSAGSGPSVRAGSASGPSETETAGRPSAAGHLQRGFMQAVDDFDVPAMRKVLLQAKVELGQRVAAEEFIPLIMAEVGDRWAHGSLRIFQEHVATETVKTFLGEMLASHVSTEGSPAAVAALPARQTHEIGLLVSAVAAQSDGFRVAYMGADAPFEEIARAAELHHARVVLLSITYPENDPQLLEELRQLRSALPPEISMLVGGRSAEGYVGKLNVPRAQNEEPRNLIYAADMQGLHAELAGLQ